MEHNAANPGTDYEPLQLRGFYRSETHLPLWEVIEEGGIWRQLGMKVSFEYCGSSNIAEAALFDGSVDFISGNHITPYALVARGKPIVCLASPSNKVNDKLVSRRRLASVAELRGLRVGDTALSDPTGGYNHLRGNHMLYVMRAGLKLDDVEWVEVAANMEQFRTVQFEALQADKMDATFVTGGVEQYEKAGFHVLAPEPLPMITGPTLTSATTTLKKKDRLAERLVKALVLGVHFVRTRKGETERILEELKRKVPELAKVNYNSVAKLDPKPYPDHRAIGNAYQLCCMKAAEAKEVSPVKLWDLHYLRDLDDSGFIGGLYEKSA